jgi:hypothetical protein
MLDEKSNFPWTQLEQIDYDLKIEPWNYAGTHRALLVKTIARLPRRVQERVCDDGPVFLLVSDSAPSASMELWRHPKGPYILLNFGGVKVNGRNRRRLQQTIAHEIAHFILKHWRMYDPESGLKAGRRIEAAADNLCEKWGFGRAWTERGLAMHQKMMEGKG